MGCYKNVPWGFWKFSFFAILWGVKVQKIVKFVIFDQKSDFDPPPKKKTQKRRKMNIFKIMIIHLKIFLWIVYYLLVKFGKQIIVSRVPRHDTGYGWTVTFKKKIWKKIGNFSVQLPCQFWPILTKKMPKTSQNMHIFKNWKKIRLCWKKIEKSSFWLIFCPFLPKIRPKNYFFKNPKMARSKLA